MAETSTDPNGIGQGRVPLVDSHRFDELNKSPFGTDLHLLTHRLPRNCETGTDWELERGFHLTVLGEDLLELTLRTREPIQSDSTLPLFGTSSVCQGQDRFLIWNCPGQYDPNRFHSFSETLRSRTGVHVGLILSQIHERSQALLDFPKYRGCWKQTDQPVVQVFQDLPDSGYFSVEKSLFNIGRIGRRLCKLAKLRRLMPW